MADPAFDPDAFLADSHDGADFDPDAFLAGDGEVTEEGGLSNGPGTTGALNALDSLSVVGLPTVLSAKDTLFGEDSDNPDSKTPRGVLDRYRRNKDFYKKGMEGLEKRNPKSAFLGQMAPAAITGGGLASQGLKGALKIGAISGIARGATHGESDTAGGDIAGTAKDALADGVVGAGTAGLGYGVAKAAAAPVKWASNKAKEGLGKFRSEVEGRVRSQIGEANQVQGEGIGGLMNENDRAAKIKELIAKVRAEVPGASEDLNQARRAAEAADRAKIQGQEALKRNGNQAAPPHQQMFDEHSKELRGELNKRIVGGAKDAAVAAGAFKVNPLLGAAVAGSKYGALKDAGRAISMHPALMDKVVKLAPVQNAIARLGGRAGSVPKNIDAIVHSLRNHPDVKRVLDGDDGLKMDVKDANGDLLYSER